MFPLSDSIKPFRFPILNYALIAVTIYVFLLQLNDPDGIISRYALIPGNIDFGNYLTLIPFVTAVFLHGGFLHLLSNMWFLKVFGDNVETHLNPFIFLILYFMAGITGNVAQYLMMPNSAVPMIGASGAVAGVLGCYFVLFPHAKIRTLLFIFFFATITRISAGFILGYWFVLQIISAVGSVPGLGAQGGVAFFAHAAGFVIGVVFGNIYKNRRGQVLEQYHE